MSNYKYTGVLPYAKNNGNVYFLLGRESIVPNWSESGKFSDSGGAPHDQNEDSLISAARECFEETMGILGCETTLKSLLTQNASKTLIPSMRSLIYILPIDYDENLPTHFNRIYNYLTKCMGEHSVWKGFKHISSCPEGYCEKIEMKWVSRNELTIATNNQDNNYRSSFLKSMDIIIKTF